MRGAFGGGVEDRIGRLITEVRGIHLIGDGPSQGLIEELDLAEIFLGPSYLVLW